MHESLADHLAELAGLVGDDLDRVLETLQDVVGDLDSVDHDDVVKLVGAVLTGAAGAVTRHHLTAAVRPARAGRGADADPGRAGQTTSLRGLT